MLLPTGQPQGVGTSDPIVWLSHTLFSPWGHLWYMAGLPIWRMLWPLFAKLKYPVCWSVVFGLLCYFYVDMGTVEPLGFHRNMANFPFFVLGAAVNKAKARDQLLALLSRPTIRKLAAGWLLLWWVLHAYTSSTLTGIGALWIYNHQYGYSYGAGLQDLSPELGLLYCLVVYALQAVSLLALLAVVPKHSLPFGLTRKGVRTLCNYILHYAVLMMLATYTWIPFNTCLYNVTSLDASGCFGSDAELAENGWFVPNVGLWEWLLLLLSLAVVFVLTTEAVYWLFTLVLNPPTEFLLEGGPGCAELVASAKTCKLARRKDQQHQDGDPAAQQKAAVAQFSA